MRFHLSDDQREIQRTARDLLAARSSWERVRTNAEAHQYDEELWKEVCELGWPGIAVSEEHGGSGLGLVELTVLVEELGAACATVPFLGTALAAAVLQSAGSDEQRSEWLPRLASGDARGAVGSAGALIPDAVGADVVVVLDGEGARVVDSAAVEAVDAIDPTRRYGRVGTAEGAALPGDVATAHDQAATIVSAELVGLCQRALDMTLAYVKDRKQFGVPVGTFQAVQHKAAEMLLHTEGGRAATSFAAWTADAEPERLPLAAGIAKAWTSDAGRATTAAAIQLHGGIGFTWEADVHWLYKRAQLDAALLGGGGTHRANVARLAAQRGAGVAAAV